MVKVGGQEVPQAWNDLMEEIYLIARNFHWPLSEIEALPNWERKLYADMIRTEHEAKKRAIEEAERKAKAKGST